MGMFDYVRCELPLPAHQGEQYQTKDFANPWMLEYVISPDGQLWRDDEIVPFDGDIHFYDYDDLKGIDVDYRATFREDRCVEICHLVDGKWRRVWQPAARETGGAA